MGDRGVDKFLATHRCNAVCRYLKLPIINAKNDIDSGGNTHFIYTHHNMYRDYIYVDVCILYNMLCIGTIPSEMYMEQQKISYIDLPLPNPDKAQPNTLIHQKGEGDYNENNKNNNTTKKDNSTFVLPPKKKKVAAVKETNDVTKPLLENSTKNSQVIIIIDYNIVISIFVGILYMRDDVLLLCLGM